MKKNFILLFAVLSLASTAFAYTPKTIGFSAKNNNDRIRAKRNLFIGLGSIAVGSGICIGSYTGYMKKYDVTTSKLDDLSARYSTNEINDDQYNAGVSEINNQNIKDRNAFYRNTAIGGAVFLTGGAFLIDSMIHYRRSNRLTAMATWNTFYVAYRF